MKRSTQIISGGPTSLNISNLNLKNNAELSKAFDLLYLHVSPVPKPFPGYTSLENVVSKNLQASNADFRNKHCNQSQFHASACNLHSSLDALNTSVESYGSMPSSHNLSTSRIIQAIKERRGQLINSTGNETVLNTFSVTKDKRNENPSLESCELKESTTGTFNEKCNEKDVSIGKANGHLMDIKDAQVVLKKCDSLIKFTKKQQPRISDNKSPDEDKVTMKDTEINILTDWIIKPVKGCNGVCVEGKKKGMEDFWHSTAIAEVRKPKVVVTISGSVYRLKGRINKLCTIDNGFPKEIATAFANGFPKNWRELIQDYFTSIEKSISFYKEETPVKMKKRSIRSQLLDKKANTEEMLEKTIMTRHGLIQQQFNVSDMVVTRSGRISLPPLKRWVGQHYVMDSISNTITVAFKTKIGEKFLNQETQQILQTSMIMQKDIYHKSLSNSLNSPSCLSSHSKENINKTFPNPRGRKPDRNRLNKNNLEENLKIGCTKKSSKPDDRNANSKLKSKDEAISMKKRRNSRICSKLEDSVKQKKGRTRVSGESDKSFDQKKKKVSTESDRAQKRRKTPNSSFSSQHNDSSPGDANCVSPELVNRKPTASSSRKRKCSSSQTEESNRKKKSKVDEEKTPDAWSEREQNRGRKPDRNRLNKNNLEENLKIGCTKKISKPDDRNANSKLKSKDEAISMKKRRSSRICSKLEDSVKQKKGITRVSGESDKSFDQKKKKVSRESDRAQKRRKTPNSSLSSQHNDSSPGDANCVSPELVNRKPTASRSRKRKCSSSQTKESNRKKKTKVDEEKTPDAWSEREQNLFHRGRKPDRNRLNKNNLEENLQIGCTKKSSKPDDRNANSKLKSKDEAISMKKRRNSRICSKLEDSVMQKKGITRVSGESDKSFDQKKKKVSRESDRAQKRSKTPNSSLSSQHNDSSPGGANCVSPELVNRKPTASRSRKRKCSSSQTEESNRKKKTKVDEEKTPDAWSEREQNLFHRALQIISSAEPNFWIKVSQFVGSRSDVQCQEFHTNYLETVDKPKLATNKPKKENKNKGRPKGEPIKGGKGTLKRKKDLRAFLDEQNEGYEDDLFESSPMLKKMPKSLLNFDFHKNDSDIFGQNHNFFTPIAGGRAIDTPSTNIRAAIASVRKGWLDQGVVTEETPISSKRQKGDMIIKHFNDRKKKGLNFPEQKEASKDLELSSLPVKSLFTPVARPHISIEGNEDDHDEKHLYYWDDDD